MAGIHAVPLPTSEPPADEAPKRGRGRPRKEPGSDAAPRARRSTAPAVTVDAVGGLLFMVNIPLSMIGPLQKDAMEPDEITVLAQGIVEQCKASPAFKRYVQVALRASGATGVLVPLSVILARRAARHGLLPQEADASLGGLIAVMVGKASLNDLTAPDMEGTETPTEPQPPIPPVASPFPPGFTPGPSQPIPAGSFDVPVD